MADISMCAGTTTDAEGKVTICALKESCYRHTAEAYPCKTWRRSGQAMMDFVRHDYDSEKKTCKSYWPIGDRG